MWPWEHAIVGYVAFSLFCHLYYRDSPGGLEAVAVVVASVFPDVIDKPLAWEFGVFESGYALGHSILFAVPLAIAAGLLARRVDRTRVGIAFGVGYLLHLPADVLDGYARGGVFDPGILLWPVDSGGPYGRGDGFVRVFLELFARYRDELLAGDLPTYLWFQLGLAAVALALWLYDGAPVLRELLGGGKRLAIELAGRSDGSTGPARR